MANRKKVAQDARNLKQRWCSVCFHQAGQTITGPSLVTRHDFECSNCGAHTVVCRAPGCSNMAVGKIKVSQDDFISRTRASLCDNFCAEHSGRIASFENLSLKFSDIAEYQLLFKGRKLNYSKAVTGTAAGAAISASIFFPFALAAAPSLASGAGGLGLLGAASTGTSISSLSGAALTSASLAAVGGSVAGGTALIAAAGAALGGINGGVISNAYFGQVRDFGVHKIKHKEGRGPAVVCIDGFLTQGDEGTRANWIRGLESHFPENPWYHVTWESKCLKDLGNLAQGGAGVGGLNKLTALAKKAMKKPPKGLVFAQLLAMIAKNPWHVAVVKSMMAGALLADLLTRTRQRRGFILVGHSLGARVIYYALQNLSTREGEPLVKSAILLGGAVGKEGEGWSAAKKAVSGHIYNCYSERDDVLKYLYSVGTGLSSQPVGRGAIVPRRKGIKNLDMTSLISGHTQYKPSLEQVFRKIGDVH